MKRQMGGIALVATMTAGLLIAPTGAEAASWETLINGGSFADRPALMAEWNFRYPWGSDHNGSARMFGSATDNTNVYLSPAGVLNLKANRISGNEGNSSSTPYLPIRYHSGAIHAKDQVLVNDQSRTTRSGASFRPRRYGGAGPRSG